VILEFGLRIQLIKNFKSMPIFRQLPLLYCHLFWENLLIYIGRHDFFINDHNITNYEQDLIYIL
jgi:hypothetical protein